MTVAKRVVEQAIGEQWDGSPLPDPHKGKNPALLHSLERSILDRSVPAAVAQRNGRAEECAHHRLPRSRSFRVNHFRGIDSLR
jgi:hypothetical protein